MAWFPKPACLVYFLIFQHIKFEKYKKTNAVQFWEGVNSTGYDTHFLACVYIMISFRGV